MSGWGREDLRRDNANHGAPAEAGAAEVEERQVESVRAPLDFCEYSCLLIRQSRWQGLALLLGGMDTQSSRGHGLEVGILIR